MQHIYMSPSKGSEVIPMLAEGLLLYDAVTLDVSCTTLFDVLAANISQETMERLIDNDLLHFLYHEHLPIFSTQTKKWANSTLLLDLNGSSIPPFDYKKLEGLLRPVYSSDLIERIKQKIKPSCINYDLILQNCHDDLHNSLYMEEVFYHVKSEFSLPDFTVEIVKNGCLFHPPIGAKKPLSKKILDDLTYGLYIIAETNYRLALLNQFGNVACETEYETFLSKKLSQVFSENQYPPHSSNLMELCKIHNFPDIKELVASGLFNLKDILELRDGEGQILRRWLSTFSRNCITANMAFSNEYVKFLANKKGLSLPLPARTVVFGFLQFLSLSHPLTSTLLSAVNDFVLPKVAEAWQPRFFFDKARKIQIDRLKTR